MDGIKESSCLMEHIAGCSIENLEMRDLMRKVQELLELSKAESRELPPTAGECMIYACLVESLELKAYA